ncbi:hypothetical protein [Streptomyces acidiscabies]|uniref:hypothetical protein n=1 Tax=Streptomyces acidiscabies TaxID=42234 RepID=UPI00095106D2|nr:hypothetical protein [Streptomyces acidiscabies]
MSAREWLYKRLTGGTPVPEDEATTGLDAHRAEGLLAAAMWFERSCPEVSAVLPACMCHAAPVLRQLAGEGEAPAPGLFQPGRTYALRDWRFRCMAVDTDPNTGRLTAIGWLRAGDCVWTTYACNASEWSGEWTDVTGGAS